MKYFIVLILIFTKVAFAQGDLTIIPIGEAQMESDKMMIYSAKADSKTSAMVEEFLNIIRNDFSFYKKYFQVLKSVEDGQNQSLEDFIKEKYSFVVTSTSTTTADNIANVVLKIVNVRTKSELTPLSVSLAKNTIRSMAHETADNIYQKLTGKKSIFKSKIVFTSDHRSSGKNYFKELYMMDFDGNNIRQLTHFKGTVISPSMNYQNNKIVYSLIPNSKGERTIQLHILDLETMTNKLISSLPGINSGAIFTPDDKNLILTLSYSGNSEIYLKNIASGELRHITKNAADDVDPSLNKSGNKMAFLSNRAGKAMIYTIDPQATEKNVKRVSFIGKFNATPSFAPDAENIVFSSWENAFDIYRISTDGSELVRLTKDFGSNEDPNYSPDGEFIIFSSRRVKGAARNQDVYIMDKDGEIIGPLTHDFGICSSPRWSK